MANWKKVATMNTEGQIAASITGRAYGGLEGMLNVSQGGTGADTSGWPAGSMPVMTGNGTWNYVTPPSGAGKYMVSTGDNNGWEWLDVATSHHHDSSYLKIADTGTQTLAGSLNVLGAITADSYAFLEFNSLEQVTGSNVMLDATTGGTGDNLGLFLDVDGSTSLNTGDPAILWDHSTLRWQMGREGNMQHIMLIDSSTAVEDASATDAGTIAFDAEGNPYIAVG